MCLSRLLHAVSAATLLLSATLACGRGEITLPETASTQELTVDASTGWVYVDLASGTTRAQTDAATSSTWDIGFSATSVVLNGGTNGPAGMVGYCLCQNASATNDQTLAMTPSTQAEAFARVNSASVPPASATWAFDVFATNKWYKYNLTGDNRIAPTFNVYLVRRGTTVYKLQLINYYGPAGETRRITFRYDRVTS